MFESPRTSSSFTIFFIAEKLRWPRPSCHHHAIGSSHTTVSGHPDGEQIQSAHHSLHLCQKPSSRLPDQHLPAATHHSVPILVEATITDDVGRELGNEDHPIEDLPLAILKDELDLLTSFNLCMESSPNQSVQHMRVSRSMNTT
jgi:hypothetical protein